MKIFIGKNYNRSKVIKFIDSIPKHYYRNVNEIYFYNRGPFPTKQTKQWSHVNGFIFGAYTPKNKVIEIFCKGYDWRTTKSIFCHEIGHAVLGASEKSADEFGMLLVRYINEL
jgi:hypothetical protein